MGNYECCSCCSSSSSTPVIDYPGHVKLVVYDFDLTISEEHLYSVLMGVQDPSALHKLGKDRIVQVFGGTERIQRLKKHFDELEGQCELTIISFGYTNIIRESFRMVDIDPNKTFTKIVGRDSNSLSRVALKKWKLIEQWRNQRHLNREQVCYIDDDSNNITLALENYVCLCVDIPQRKGMTETHFKKVENLVFGRSSEETSTTNDETNRYSAFPFPKTADNIEMQDPSISFSSSSREVIAPNSDS